MGNPNEKTIKEFVDKVKEGNFTEEQSSKLLTLVEDEPTEEQFHQAVKLWETFTKENSEAADAKHKAEQEAKEIELGHYDAIKLADTTIINEGTKEELHKKIDKVMESLK